MNMLLDSSECPIFFLFLGRNVKQDQQMQISKFLSECTIITIFIRFQKSGVALSTVRNTAEDFLIIHITYLSYFL